MLLLAGSVGCCWFGQGSTGVGYLCAFALAFVGLVVLVSMSDRGLGEGADGLKLKTMVSEVLTTVWVSLAYASPPKPLNAVRIPSSHRSCRNTSLGSFLSSLAVLAPLRSDLLPRGVS